MWSDIYQSPTPPSFEKIFYSNQGGGDMAPCALSYASDGGTARICQRGAKARVWEGVPPSHGREIFQKFVSENGIFLHIRYLYLIGVVYVVA